MVRFFAGMGDFDVPRFQLQPGLPDKRDHFLEYLRIGFGLSGNRPIQGFADFVAHFEIIPINRAHFQTHIADGPDDYEKKKTAQSGSTLTGL